MQTSTHTLNTYSHKHTCNGKGGIRNGRVLEGFNVSCVVLCCVVLFVVMAGCLKV